jgi:hypothetical protein
MGTGSLSILYLLAVLPSCVLLRNGVITVMTPSCEAIWRKTMGYSRLFAIFRSSQRANLGFLFSSSLHSAATVLYESVILSASRRAPGITNNMVKMTSNILMSAMFSFANYLKV